MSWEKLRIYMKAIRFLDDSTDDYLYIYDLVNNQIFFTDKIREKYAIPSGETGVPLDTWINIIYSKDREKLEKNIHNIKNGLISSHEMEYRLLDKLGNKVWICCRGSVIKDKEGSPLFLIGCISESAMERKVDSLTGLWNYEKFMEDMSRNRREDRGYLMIFGVDNFRHINVKNGRAFGNQILKIIVNIMEENADCFIKLYRLDGDRFAVNFPCKTRAEVTVFYRKLKKKLESYCTISAGVVDYGSDREEDSSTIYQYAENAMDRAKKEGKDKIIFFSFKDYQKIMEQIFFQDELKQAVKNQFKGFYLCYQPQINSKDYSVYGAEALIRYRSPQKGIVSPLDFIPFLEQTGMICQVGEWVLRTACMQCALWRKVIPDFHIGVNISYVQLKQKNITETVLKILRESGLPGNALTLELTESMQLQDFRYFNKIFYVWKEHGIKISIDDFGTGYSSLSYLKSIDIDEAKIDRCFVSRIHCNVYNYRLLRNIIELAHCAKIRVCCEGVETEEELMTLQKLKPDLLQGFLFAKPYTVEEFQEAYLNQDSKRYKERIKKEKNFCHMNQVEKEQVIEELQKDEIMNLVDGMDDIIYVSDTDTCDLLYLNSAGRNLTGVYDYKGRKCYQVLQGKDAPCENCNNKMLKKDSFSIREVNNRFLDEHFIVRDKLIPWQGKMARLEIAMDVKKTDWKNHSEMESLYTLNEKRENKLSWNFNHRLLNRVNLGAWVIRIDQINGRHEMYTDDVMNRILGLENAVTPEECYLYWYSRIAEKDREYINLTVDNIIRSGEGYQVEYTWNHPEKGEILVRCMGIRAEDREGIISIEGYHRIIDNLKKLEKNENGQWITV